MMGVSIIETPTLGHHGYLVIDSKRDIDDILGLACIRGVRITRALRTTTTSSRAVPNWLVPAPNTSYPRRYLRGLDGSSTLVDTTSRPISSGKRAPRSRSTLGSTLCGASRSNSSKYLR